MKKYGITGPERVGKTTLAYDIASHITKHYGIDAHVLPENLLRMPELNLNTIESQYIFIFDQIIQELKITSTLESREIDRGIIIVDRTVMDVIPYLVELYTLDPLARVEWSYSFYNRVVEMLKEWMKSFSILFCVEDTIYKGEPTEFIGRPDRIGQWKARKRSMKNIIENLHVPHKVYVNTCLLGKSYDELVAYLSNEINKSYRR